MAFNGSGTFVRSHNWVTDKTNVVPVTASRMDTECDGYATGLSTALCKDGQQTATARIPFALGVSSMDGTVASASYAHVSDLNTGLYFPAADQWGLTAGGVGTLTSTATALTANVAMTFSGALTPAISDGAALGSVSLMWSDLFLASGAVINFNAGDVTLTHSANTLAYAGASSGYTFDAAVLPSADDAAAIGASGTAWSDLFLASGSVINWAASDVTLTHAANTLTFAGASVGYVFDSTISGTAITASGALTGATAAGAQIATQAEQETGTAVDKLVTPGRQHFHPGAAKAWAKFVADGADGPATVSASYNITGVNKDSTGDYTVTIANDFSSANYCIVVTAMSAGGNQFGRVRTQAAGTFTIKTVNTSGADENPDFIMFACYGDL